MPGLTVADCSERRALVTILRATNPWWVSRRSIVKVVSTTRAQRLCEHCTRS
jgi:hypothetical protein